MLNPGDKVLHRFNRDLGPGEVVSTAGGRLRVRFPRTDSVLEFSVRDHAFTPLVLPADADPDRWWESFHEDIVERLARLEVDRVRAWENRRESLHLSRLREARGLGSFLGGRIEIFPHQLHVAEQAVASDPVRWLLADEVGLGKTVEACLVLSRLLRTGRAKRVVIVAPASLTVQWLGELYRKFHQLFVLLDGERRKDVLKDFGAEFNPFEIHPRSVVALEDLVADAEFARQATQANPDLLVVDEAHRLERRRGHPGSPAYRTIAPVAEASTHCLLLSATPLEADAHGFFRLLQLLRPKEYPSWDAFAADLEKGAPLYPCTSATRREDIGGLPPREPHLIPLSAWPPWNEAEDRVRELPQGTALDKRRRSEALQAALSAPSGGEDPRMGWLVEQAPGWRDAGDKMLIFVHDRAALDIVKKELERATLQRVGVFHEDLSPAARDLEVAQFAQSAGPTILVSTEAGGEGRNFEFCRGLVLFDLPWDPVLVEQRIGRLDRINRTRPVEIYTFVPLEGFGAKVAALYEALGIFSMPLGGLDRSLGHVEEAVRRAAGEGAALDIATVIQETQEARKKINRALYHDLHRNRYAPELAKSILERIPPELDTLTAKVVREACRQFGFERVPKPGVATWYFEFGHEAVIDHLPGAAEGTRWLGTFDREEAVANETLDFFASGHPLVEGVLQELEDGHRGEVALMEVEGTGTQGTGLVALLKQDAEFVVYVIDGNGRPRPDWAPFFTTKGYRRRDASPASWGLTGSPEALTAWAKRVRELLYPLQEQGVLAAVAAFRLS